MVYTPLSYGVGILRMKQNGEHFKTPKPHLFQVQLGIFWYFIKKPAKIGHFSFLGNTFQGQKQGCKDLGLHFQLRPHRLGFPKFVADKAQDIDDPKGSGHRLP